MCVKNIYFKCEDGRKPMLGFMEKPSKKLYPDYYEVISEPIDFLEIENKIRNEQYRTEQELINDFKLMFSNCRTYNEENSTIYEDAALLEKVMNEKATQFLPTPEKEKKIYVRVYEFYLMFAYIFVMILYYLQFKTSENFITH